jgi:hypothetical protein
MGFGGRKVSLEGACQDTVAIVRTFPVVGPSRAACLVEGMGMGRVGIRRRLLPVLHPVAFLETAVGASSIPPEDEKDIRRENLDNIVVEVDPAFLAAVGVDLAFPVAFLAEIP